MEKEQIVADEGEEEVGPLPLFIPGQKGGRNAYVFFLTPPITLIFASLTNLIPLSTDTEELY